MLVIGELTGWLAQLVGHPLFSRKVVGSIPGRVIPKTLKMGPVAFLLGAQLLRVEQGNNSMWLVDFVMERRWLPMIRIVPRDLRTVSECLDG